MKLQVKRSNPAKVAATTRTPAQPDDGGEINTRTARNSFGVKSTKIFQLNLFPLPVGPRL